MQYVQRTDACWLWTGRTQAEGYSIFTLYKERKLGHRLSYELFVGPIPKGMQIDHQCHTRDLTCDGGRSCAHRRCVNPEHLKIVTPRENTMLSPNTLAAKNAAKDRCKHGHDYTPDNTYVWRGQRTCRACNRRLSLESKARRRAAKRAGANSGAVTSDG